MRDSTVIAGPLDGKAFTSTLEQHAELRVSMLLTTTRRHPIVDEDIGALCDFFHAVVESRRPFVFVHDLRELTPWVSRSQLGVVRRWIQEHDETLPDVLRATVVVVRSPMLTTILNWLIHVVKPTQPVRLVLDMPSAQDFLHEHFGRPPPSDPAQCFADPMVDDPMSC